MCSWFVKRNELLILPSSDYLKKNILITSQYNGVCCDAEFTCRPKVNKTTVILGELYISTIQEYYKWVYNHVQFLFPGKAKIN